MLSFLFPALSTLNRNTAVLLRSIFFFFQGEAEKNEINLRRHMQDFFKDTGKRPKPKQIERADEDEENEAGRGGRAVTPGRYSL